MKPLEVKGSINLRSRPRLINSIKLNGYQKNLSPYLQESESSSETLPSLTLCVCVFEQVHIFPEGRVNQPGIDPNQLLRFKWGVSRIILEASQAPIILPIYLQGKPSHLPLLPHNPLPVSNLLLEFDLGFEKVMPENRRWPFSFLPRPFQSIKISIGSPILSGSSLDSLRSRFGLTDDESQKRQIRIELANSLRHELASLGTTTHFHPPPQHLS